MKKEYVAPTMETMTIETTELIAASPGGQSMDIDPNTSSDYMNSKPGTFGLWDEE